MENGKPFPLNYIPQSKRSRVSQFTKNSVGGGIKTIRGYRIPVEVSNEFEEGT